MTLPVVWVPGHLCGPWLYAPQIEALPGRDAVFADVTRDDRCSAMARRLLAQAPERFVIAGLSMGGMVAMEAMAAAPERIAGAVLMATDPFAAREKELAFRQKQREAVEREGVEKPASAFIDRFFGHRADGGDALKARCLAEMGAVDPAVYAAQAAALDHRRDMQPLISGFPGAVAVIAGAEDVICPAKLHDTLAAALPRAALTVIPQTGHLLTLEAPQAANAAIAALLQNAG